MIRAGEGIAITGKVGYKAFNLLLSANIRRTPRLCLDLEVTQPTTKRSTLSFS